MIFGGDYRTRICDLLRVKIRRDENRVLFAPFGAESSDKMSGWSPPCPMAPSAHFGVWVSVWVRASTGLYHCMKIGLKGISARHLMGYPSSTRWRGIYEQDERAVLIRN